jgi:predicted nucleic acid-binding Zn ribbon protein
VGRGAESVGAVLGRVLERTAWGHRVLEGRVLLLWKDAVGEAVAAHTRPLRVRDGTLVVSADDSVWKQEIGFLRGDILQKLNLQMGEPIVRELKIVISG